MRDLISGRAFEAKKKIDNAFIKSRIVLGGSAKVEQAVYLAESTGKVNAAKLVQAGICPVTTSATVPSSSLS